MPITSFTSDPETIQKGGTSKLSWTTDGCDNCVIMPPMTGQPVDSNSSLEVSPDVSTVYMLECKCSEDPSQWTALVVVER